ncbi:hypothetical protein [Paenibacillus sp. Soil522]|uniref:hypothetical protein n=1 Tax=Paenibacillus sp. Soil522 TaxID=1736388 RepID=UPI00138F9278|nr:hypothetical protein [Paenibacillus sp. Soil522]
MYYQVKSISLEDIKDRQVSSAVEQVTDSTEKEAPKALEGAVGKANEFTNKEIETQDALDVAAILLNSGLSFKEIYWLQGSASEDISIEEKQRIREVLLEKLSKEEIEALRSITTQYGKGLIILDPNYPIEAVGVKDEKERLRILNEAKEKQVNTDQSIDQLDQTVAEPNTSDSKSSLKPLTEEQKVVKEQIQKTYNSKLGALKADCVSKSTILLSELVSDIKHRQANGEKVSIDLLQNTYLPRIVSSEGHCDREFSDMLESAKERYKAEGLNINELDAWQSEYNEAKEQTQSKAILQISNLLTEK